ncbi:hypothetical protein BSL78_16883 [Apostichopus japonicus]|uniref:Aminotransferase class V domain-containing protein n=1 Tax=Stichopus japonicus TaxID=307972 RepID=A0A2G8KE62_STIJA|nr:hypothetical protein BSL78_16883 [Apostichopus japonicus]
MLEMTENILPGMIPEKINPDSFDLDEAERYLIGDTIGHETTAHDERNRGALLSQRKQRLLRYVEENTIGHRSEFVGPYGRKRAIYCDYTASGRPVNFIEDYIRDHVHPLYANTHTITGVMARQTTRFRHEARELIKKYVNASNDDVLIFTGSGTTAAVHKLLHAINLRGEKAQHTVVFVGPFEHHSNILPWKEAGAAIVRIRATDDGIFDVSHLEEELKNYTQKKRYRIGCFCAASNVTGIITDTNHVTALLHKYGALAFWDFATAGPYMRIDMNPPTTHDGLDCSKDAVYLSPHKFIGGVGTPGILLAKKKLFTNSVPSQCGGGTVLYVTRNTHFYLRNIEDKEEGGTPAIVESIRAGLAFKLKQAIGTDAIMAREVELVKTALETWKNNPNIIILGSTEAERLPIFSFIIFHPESGKLLHHNFIAVLLNDLYGIQARGGCACAGPYAQDLLGISEELAEKFIYYLLDEEDIRLSKLTKFATTEGKVSLEILKPGFLRLNLPFFFSDELIAYVLLAVDQIAKYGWKLLPQYAPNIVSGNWEFIGKKSYSDDCIITEDDSLHTITFKDGHFTAPNSPYTGSQLANVEYHQLQGEYLTKSIRDASKIYQQADRMMSFPIESYRDDLGGKVVKDDLVWFLRPRDVAQTLSVRVAFPIQPKLSPDGSTSSTGNLPTDRRLLFVPSGFDESHANKKRQRNAKSLSWKQKFKSGYPSCSVS